VSSKYVNGINENERRGHAWTLMSEEDREMRIDEPINFFVKKGMDVSKGLAVRYARVPGIHIMVRPDRCVGCGACVRKHFCRFGAISMSERQVNINDTICRGCGRCTHLCPQNALAMEVRPPKLVTGTLSFIDRGISDILDH